MDSRTVPGYTLGVIILAAESTTHSNFGLSLTLLAVDWSVRIALSVRVIMRRTSVSNTLAWLLLLLFIPLVGIIFYAMIGENRLGRRRAGRAADLSAELEHKAVAIWTAAHDDWSAKGASYTTLAKLGTAVSGLPPLRGNELELLSDANVVLDRLIADIDASKSHCHMLYYIWMPTGRGVAVADALIRAAERGVSCRVLVDAVGSKAFLRSELPERMTAAGVRVVEALPVNAVRMLFSRIDLRNHRKIAVIDGLIGYSGSQNLTDETFTSRKRRKVGPWIDATVRLRGPAVTALQTVFLTDWLQDSDENIESLEGMLRPCAPAGDSVVHVIASGPDARPDAIHHAVLTLLYSAREQIVMSTPYFVPDEATKTALQNAALRGVSVTLIMPDHLDARVVAAAARSHFDELLNAGIKIMLHEEGLLHAKTFTVDGRVAVVTSINFDVRSFRLNFEASLFIYDERFARTLLSLQRKYMAESTEVVPEEWRRRPAWRKFADNTAQLFGPLL